MKLTKVKKIKYEIDGSRCLTKCPVSSIIMIGSMNCQKCNFFKGDNVIKKYVRCSHPDNFKKKT